GIHRPKMYYTNKFFPCEFIDSSTIILETQTSPVVRSAYSTAADLPSLPYLSAEYLRGRMGYK
ncbi:MAG: hypothetical protein MUO67_00925, partial [Anaerolineales bacterium]|nr:hypothetical protein [Anaerolineales bacterium]